MIVPFFKVTLFFSKQTARFSPGSLVDYLFRFFFGMKLVVLGCFPDLKGLGIVTVSPFDIVFSIVFGMLMTFPSLFFFEMIMLLAAPYNPLLP